MPDRPLRIALVTDFFPPAVGGVEVQVHGLARALERRGHSVCVITSSRGEIPGDRLTVVRLPFAYVPRTRVGVPSLANYRRLVEELAADRPDVVHVHGLFSTLAMGGLLAAHALGIPSVTTHHSLIRVASLPLARMVYVLASHHADVVTAVSAAAARDARRASGRDEVLMLPNGMDVGPVPVRRRGAEDPIRITSVLRLKLKKLPYHLMWEFSRVLARAADPSRVRFTVVGDGPERRRVEWLAALLGLRQHIEFCGERSRAEVDRILADSSIFVSPVRAEAFGLALLEARAAGVPCVAIDGGGVSEVIEHDRHGLLTSTRSGFVAAIVRLIDDDALRERLAAGAREGIDQFSWDAACERHEEVYRLAIARRARGRSEAAA
ncbi:MAG TPA: glycosyltransferase [Vicinamibacterales bacterium]|jgi:glycosyltransferase involved in cell wall biosynthesis